MKLRIIQDQDWTESKGPDDWWRYLHCGADLPPEVMDWAGLRNSNPQVLNNAGILTALSDLNDGVCGQTESTFPTIADLIEAQL